MNQSTLIPVQSVSFELPESVSLPKFQMFQRVRCSRGSCKGSIATIVGLQWTDHNTALMERVEPGWHYTLSEVYGLEDAREILDCESSHSIMPEAYLVAVEG